MFKRVRHNIALLAPAAFLVAWGLPGAAYSQAQEAAKGEIVVRFPASFSDEQIAQAVKDAGCTIQKAIPFSFHYYVLVAPETTRTRAEADNALRPGVTPEVNAAVQKLVATPGVVANPNWLIKPYGMNLPQPKPLVPLNAPAQTTQKETKPVTRQVNTLPTLIPNDPLYDRQKWHMEMINMPYAWAIQGISPTRVVRVAVSDSGFNTAHPDFVTEDGTSLFVNPMNVTVDPVDTNVAENDPDAAAHGTHVTGTIVARTNNGVGLTGVAGLRGTGIDVRIVPIKIFGLASTVTAKTSTTVAAVNYANAQKVDVHSMSWGPLNEANPPANPVLQSAVADAVNQGIIMVAAAGNGGVTNDGIYPGSYPGVIRVTSINPARSLASYSSYGPGVDIAAPGGEGQTNGPDVVWSTSDPISTIAQLLNGNYYEGINGTSMATPHVAGAAALLIGMGATPAEVQPALVTSAQRLDETPVYDGISFSKYGGGLLDVYAAMLPFADPPFSATLVGSQDRGPSYVAGQAPITFQVVGVTKAPPVGTITLEIQTATYPTSVVRRFVEGTDFTIPRTITGTQRKGTTFTVAAPGTGVDVQLPPGRYKYVLKNGETVVGQVFTEVLSRIQPQGRTLFASPFLTRSVDAVNPEAALFGRSPVGSSTSLFTLKRYVPFLPLLTGDQYYTYSEKDPSSTLASFLGTVSDGTTGGRSVTSNGLPLSYQVTDPATSVAPAGLGYWLNLTQTTTLNLVGPTLTNSVAVQLSSNLSGWNMVGNPFTGNVAWGACAIEYNGQLYSLADAIQRGYISSALVGWSTTTQDYVYNLYPVGTLEPFNGYFVRALVDCTLIIPPGITTRSASGLKPTLANSIALGGITASNVPGQTGLPKVDGWRGRLIAQVAGDRDGQNYFGQSRSAKSGVDSQDIPKPPSGAGHAYLRFIEGSGSKAANLAFDMRPASSVKEEEWNAVVSTDRPNADVTVTWDTLSGLPRAARLTLTDTTNGKTVDMRSRSSYTFRSGDSGASRAVKITMTPGSSRGLLAITGVTLVKNGGRSAGGGYAVRCVTTDDADVTATVQSLGGNTIAQFTGRTRSVAGETNTLHWNGRLKDGSPIPPGAYIVTIEARGVNGQSATYSQPIQSLQ